MDEEKMLACVSVATIMSISCPPHPLASLASYLVCILAHLCLACKIVELLKTPVECVDIVAVLVIDIETLEAEMFK
jgi:hypothetical protein